MDWEAWEAQKDILYCEDEARSGGNIEQPKETRLSKNKDGTDPTSLPLGCCFFKQC